MSNSILDNMQSFDLVLMVLLTILVITMVYLAVKYKKSKKVGGVNISLTILEPIISKLKEFKKVNILTSSVNGINLNLSVVEETYNGIVNNEIHLTINYKSFTEILALGKLDLENGKQNITMNIFNDSIDYYSTHTADSIHRDIKVHKEHIKTIKEISLKIYNKELVSNVSVVNKYIDLGDICKFITK